VNRYVYGCSSSWGGITVVAVAIQGGSILGTRFTLKPIFLVSSVREVCDSLLVIVSMLL
jgi:hypothetical protein